MRVGGLALSVQVFVLMPLRHTPTVDRLRCLMERIEGMTDTHEQHGLLLDKFRRQTLRRLQVRVSTAKLSPGTCAVWCLLVLMRTNRQVGGTHNLQDLEGKQWTDGQEILEFHPFEADETQMLTHPLARCVLTVRETKQKPLRGEGGYTVPGQRPPRMGPLLVGLRL